MLIVILSELMWIGSRLATTTAKSGLPEELLSELKEIREELYWFKDDKFAGHLFKEMNSSVGELGELKEELYWFKDDKFAGQLFKEINSSVERVLESLDAITRSLDNIASTLERIADDIPSR